MLQCIGFVTGGKEPPKSFAESEGYETVYLAMTNRAGEGIVLQRSLKGGEIRELRADLGASEADNPIDLKVRLYGSGVKKSKR